VKPSSELSEEESYSLEDFAEIKDQSDMVEMLACDEDRVLGPSRKRVRGRAVEL
jgi:hypothetical protein